jgi:hypothetical protein
MAKVDASGKAGPVRVRYDARRRLTVHEGPPGSVKRKRPTAADESRFPVASVVLDILAAYTATALASLLLLPVSSRKVCLHLPRGASALTRPEQFRNFAGGKAALGETALRFGSTALLPPPLSSLVGYLGSIPLRGAVVRAQSGVFAAARTSLPKLTSLRGFSALWAAHVVRDLPFLLVETYTLTAMALGRIRVAKRVAMNTAGNEKVSTNTQVSPAPGRRGGIQIWDAVLAGAVAGVFTVPLDLLHTRVIVAGRPSIARTSMAVVRLAKRRGLPAAVMTSTGAGLYIAECMAKPVAQLAIYAGVRATYVATWLRFRMRNEVETSDAKSK